MPPLCGSPGSLEPFAVAKIAYEGESSPELAYRFERFENNGVREHRTSQSRFRAATM